MRSRSRRSASNYLSAAILEITIMGIFVIIAQPQLRQAFVELLHPADVQSLPVQPVRYGPQSSGLQSSGLQSSGETVSRVSSGLPDPMSLTTTSMIMPNRNGAQQRSSYYAPLEQFESFRVAPATQLAAGDWNIASAAQSPRPLSGWAAPYSVETDYRGTYPPPYGTQSQWK